MSGINLKKPLALLLAGTVAFSAVIPTGTKVHAEGDYQDNEDLYFAALSNKVIENVQTTTVIKGDFVVNAACKARIEYQNVSYVFNRINSGRVEQVAMLVANGDVVKRGDPICEVKVSVDTSTVDDLETKIEAEEESIENYSYTNNNLLKRYQTLAQTAASPSDRRVAQLLYDRLSVDFAEELQRRSDALEAERATLSTYRSLKETQYIKANMSGTVADIQRRWPGETLGSYAYICTIYDTSDVRVAISSGGEDLSYNQPVLAVQPAQGGSIQVPGRVATCLSPALSSNLVGKTNYIELQGDPSKFKINEEISIRYESQHMKNALLVPKNAVLSDLGGDYVYLYKDGHQFKQYFVSGGSNSEYYWAAKGLEEGDTVVIKN